MATKLSVIDTNSILAYRFKSRSEKMTWLGFCLYRRTVDGSLNCISVVNVTSDTSSAKNVGNSSGATNKPGSDIKSETPVESEVDPEPHRIRLMSWNIDGLEQNYIVDRTKEVCATIQK